MALYSAVRCKRRPIAVGQQGRHGVVYTGPHGVNVIPSKHEAGNITFSVRSRV